MESSRCRCERRNTKKNIRPAPLAEISIVFASAFFADITMTVVASIGLHPRANRDGCDVEGDVACESGVSLPKPHGPVLHEFMSIA
jgi:hypothetical protein